MDVLERLVAPAVRHGLVAGLGLLAGLHGELDLVLVHGEGRREVVAEEERGGPRSEVPRAELDEVLGAEGEPRLHVALDREVAGTRREAEVEEDEREEDEVEEGDDEVDPAHERREEEDERRRREDRDGASRGEERVSARGSHGRGTQRGTLTPSITFRIT